MRSPFYKWAFPETQFKEDQDTQKEFTTTRGGQRIATSIGGAITGKGADVLILDDANDVNLALSKPHLEQVIYYYSNEIYTRLNDRKKGAIINIQQRCNANDLTGYLLETDKEFELLKLPIQFEERKIINIGRFQKEIEAGDLLNEEREDQNIIEKTKEVLGALAFSGQYMQTPISAEGNLFKESWLKWHEKKGFDKIFQSWDTAVKTNQMNDYSVCTTWGVEANQYFLLDLFKAKLEFPALKQALINQAQKWKPNLSIGIILVVQHLFFRNHCKAIPTSSTNGRNARQSESTLESRLSTLKCSVSFKFRDWVSITSVSLQA
jgi:hypothetical protein